MLGLKLDHVSEQQDTEARVVCVLPGDITSL